MSAQGLIGYEPAWLLPARRRRTEMMLEALREQVTRDHKTLVRELREIRRAAEQGQKRLEKAIAAHEEALAALPDLRARVDRSVAAYIHDGRSASRVQAFARTLNREAVMAHARNAVERAELRMDPCAHVVIDQLFPDLFYDSLVDSLPSPIFFDKVSERRDEMPVPFTFAPAYSRLVWDLFHDAVEQAVLPAMIERFRPALDEFVRASWPTLGSWEQSQITLRVANPRLMLRRPGYLIKPHRDPRWAFLIALFYIAPRGAAQTYGTQLYRLKTERDESHTSPMWMPEEECELVHDVPGIGNSAVVFLNSTGAHGASVPEDAPKDFLRYVYQARFSPDTATKNRLLALLEGQDRDRWVATR